MDRDPQRTPWWKLALEALRALAAVVAVIRFIGWLISLFGGGSS